MTLSNPDLFLSHFFCHSDESWPFGNLGCTTDFSGLKKLAQNRALLTTCHRHCGNATVALRSVIAERFHLPQHRSKTVPAAVFRWRFSRSSLASPKQKKCIENAPCNCRRSGGGRYRMSPLLIWNIPCTFCLRLMKCDRFSFDFFGAVRRASSVRGCWGSVF